jgi:hypothetical protein
MQNVGLVHEMPVSVAPLPGLDSGVHELPLQPSINEPVV